MKTKLSYLSKLVIFLLMFASTAFTQNITNTLGTGGVFTIKDASNNYLSINQSTGRVDILKSLRLEYTTSSSQGILFKGTQSFLHNYGSDNTFLGINSGNFTMTGTFNTGVGYNSLLSNTSGIRNTAIGWGTLYSNTTGDNNTAVGLISLYSNTTGYSNTALGSSSLYLNTIGHSNTAMGLNSLRSNTDGHSNTAVGLEALFKNTTGYYNTAVGKEALWSNTTGWNNTAVGLEALYSNTIGKFNTAVGWASLYYNTTGTQNSAVGESSLLANTTGFSNTAFGFQSLYSNTTGGANTAIGFASLTNSISGFFNTALGFSTGTIVTTGENLTLIGYNAEPTSGSAVNQITMGNNQVTSLRCNVTTITSLSDARDKKNIKDLSLGLDFIMKIKPRLFKWDKREWYENNISDGSKMKETPTAGFIAQELDEAQTTENAEWLNLVLKDNPEKLEATSGNLLPVMVKAIQELKVESEKLKVACLTARQENIELKNENKWLSVEVQSLKSMNEKIVKLERIINELTSNKHTSFDNENENKTISKKVEVK